MKKIRMLVVFMMVFMMSVTKVSAACEASVSNQIRNEAYKVQVSYEVAQEEEPRENYDLPDGLTEEGEKNYVSYVTFFKIYITNLTENIYVEVKDSFSGKTKKYTYEDSENGTVIVKDYDLSRINTFTIDVKAVDSDCIRNNIRTIKKTLPRRNEFSTYGMCEGISEYYLCHEYVEYEQTLSAEEMFNRMETYRANKEKQEKEEEKEKEKGFFEKNKNTIIATSVVIIVAGVATAVVIIVRKRRVV